MACSSWTLVGCVRGECIQSNISESESFSCACFQGWGKMTEKVDSEFGLCVDGPSGKHLLDKLYVTATVLSTVFLCLTLYSAFRKILPMGRAFVVLIPVVFEIVFNIARLYRGNLFPSGSFFAVEEIKMLFYSDIIMALTLYKYRKMTFLQMRFSGNLHAKARAEIAGDGRMFMIWLLAFGGIRTTLVIGCILLFDLSVVQIFLLIAAEWLCCFVVQIISIRNNFGTVVKMLMDVAKLQSNSSSYDASKGAKHAMLKARLLYVSCSVAFFFASFLPIWTPQFSSQTLAYRYSIMWVFIYSIFILQVVVNSVNQPKRKRKKLGKTGSERTRKSSSSKSQNIVDSKATTAAACSSVHKVEVSEVNKE